MKAILLGMCMLVGIIGYGQSQTTAPNNTSISISPTSTTALGNHGGKTYEFTNTSWPNYRSSCYTYGFTTSIKEVINGYNASATCGGLQDLMYNSTLSNLTSGVVVFTGTTSYRYRTPSNTYFTNTNVPVRLTATFTANSNALAVSMVDTFLLVPGKEDFEMNIILEAYSPSGANYIASGPNRWIPAISLFDSLHTDPASIICTSFSGGNWFSISTSATASNTGPYSPGDDIDLLSSGGNSYSWSGPGFTSNSQNPSISSATTANGGNYVVAVQGAVGCPDTANTIVIVGDQEIKISGNNTEISNGDTSPSSTDHTDFGCVQVQGGTLNRTYTIENTGSTDLTLTGTPRVAISGLNASDFTVTSQPSSATISGSSSLTFVVQFNPSATGTRTATISIANNDADENPYTFTIQGSGSDGIVVSSGNDAGAGTLRQAIADACDGDTITFNSVSQVTLTSGELYIDKNITIQGGTNVLIQRDASSSAFRIFEIAAGKHLNMLNLEIKGGAVTGTADGAGIYVNGGLNAHSCIFDDNEATDDGGGIYTEPATRITLTNCVFKNNTARWGGAVYVRGFARIMGCEFSNNLATTDGGALRSGTSADSVVVSSSTFSKNTSNADGGAVAVNQGVTTLINCTVSENTATNGEGGGLQKDATGTLRILNSIIASNINSSKPDIAGTITSLGYNLIGNRGAQAFSSQTEDLVGSSTSPLNPLLDDFDNYGGSTKTYALLNGSPAINTGTATNAPTTDQRGLARVGQVDRGAYEFQGAVVESITSSNANGTYSVGNTITLQVEFSDAVTVNSTTGTPQLELETGSVKRKANYVSGSGNTTLVFEYVVQSGDKSTDLSYTGQNALSTNGGSIIFNGVEAFLNLPLPGDNNSLSANKDIIIDGVAPEVINVTSTAANQTYKEGDVIPVQVVFSKQVTVTGTPQIELATGTTNRIVNYSSGSGTATLVFNYTVQAGDNNSDLDYAANNSLKLNGGSIEDAIGNNATLGLPNPGATSSLSANKNIVIDTRSPLVTSVSAQNSDGTYIVNNVVTINVTFDEAVVVTGFPRIELETGVTNRYATYVSGSGTNNLNFAYVVLPNDASSDLEYASTLALGLNGGTIKDAIGNNAVLTLPTPGAANSLSANKNIVIFTQPVFTLRQGVINYNHNDLYDYGSLNVGSSSTATFTIENKGGNTLTISTPIVLNSGLHYSVSNVQPSNNISPGGTATFTVSFNPTQAGTFLDKITIANNDTTISNFQLNLSGVGQSTIVNFFNRHNPTSFATKDTFAIYRVRFGAAISNVTPANFTVNAPASLSAPIDTVYAVNGTGTDELWEIVLADVVGDGLLNLSLNSQASASIHLSNIPYPSQFYRVDQTAPQIVSLNRNSPTDSVTNATALTYRLTLSELVLFSANDFELTTTGTATASISSINQVSASVYDISLTSVSGDGQLRLDLKSNHNVLDSAGNIISGGYTTGEAYYIDNTAPNAPSAPDLLAGSDSGISDSDNITNDNTPSFQGTAEPNSIIELFAGSVSLGTTTTNGTGNWSFTIAVVNALSDGIYNITAMATDIAGNTSIASSALSITIDTDAPNAPSTLDLLASSDSGISDSDNITNDNTPSFEGTAEAGSIVELFAGAASLGTTTTDASGDWSFTVAAVNALSDGTYSISATSTDVAGNTSLAGSALSITIDTSIPNAPSTPDLLASSDSGISDSDNNTNDNTPTFEGTADANVWVELFAGANSLGVTTADGSGNWSFTIAGANALSDGTYNITARASDTAGNMSSSSAALSITIDTDAPNTPSTPDLLASSDSGTSSSDNITNDDTPSFEGTAEAGSTVELFAGANSLGTTTTNGSGNWSFTIAAVNALSDGTYNITARATDIAGNSSTLSSALSITIDTDAPSAPSTPDLLASSDSGTSDSDNITNDDTPSFEGTAEAGSILELFAGANSLGTTMTNGSGDWSFTVATANALNDGTYNITAIATDLAGNTSSPSSALSITIDTDREEIVNVSTPKADSTYGLGEVIPIWITFNKAVYVSGTPKLTLETGTTDRDVSYSSGSGGTVLVFNYTVQTGDENSHLDYVSTSALGLNGGTIRDLAGNDAILDLFTPGAASSLSDNNHIAVRDPEIDIENGSVAIAVNDVIDFGRMEINDQEEITLTIKNNGSTPLRISMPLLLSGADYSITQQPDSLVAASGSTQMKIAFNPSSNGLSIGELRILNNDIDEANYIINLSASVYTIDRSDSNMLCLDGVDDYVEINEEAPFDFAGDFSVEGWIKVNNFTKTNQAIISKGNAWSVTRDGNSNSLRFTVTGLTNTTATATTSVNDNLWHHFAGIYNGSQLLLYIDGNLESTIATSGSPTLNNDKVQIGAINGSATFYGSLEEIRIWNEALTLSTLQEGMNAAGTHDFTKLLAYYQFNHTSTTIIEDNSSGYNGTLINGANACKSTAPVGNVEVFTLVFNNSTGVKTATGTNLEFNMNSISGDIAFVVNKLKGKSNGTQVSGTAATCNEQYWIVRPYTLSGAGTFNMDMCFEMGDCAIAGLDEFNPSNLKMYKRNDGSDGAWTMTNSASSASASDDEVCFAGITSLSQIIIGTTGLSFIPGAEIEVLDEDNNDVANNSTFTFDSTNVNQNTDHTFTIRNLGTTNLLVTTPIVATGDYSVVSQPTSVASPANTSTFTVRFTPTTTGVRTGGITFINNDLDENPYEIDFEGLGIRPRILNVTASEPDDTYILGETIDIEVEFTQNVVVTGTPQLELETGAVDRLVNYSSGSGSNVLVFTYTVQNGDESSDLEYTGINALTLNSGSIKNGVTDAIITLPVIGNGNSLSDNKDLVIDGVIPQVTNVTSLATNGSYRQGDVIAILITFDDNVYVSGTPQLELETGTTNQLVDYGSGSNSKVLTFYYTVQAVDISSDLDYASANALTLNGGTIRDTNNNNANLTLPTPGNAGSLSANKDLVIDNINPEVTNVTSSTQNGSYKAGSTINVTIQFSEDVFVTGSPQIELETGTTNRMALYTGGSGSSSLSFTYTVQSGDESADLDYVASNALVLNSGTIKDLAGNNAILTLPNPGAANSLADNKNIIIDTQAPNAPSITAITSDNGFSNSDGITNDQTLVFSGTAEANSTLTLYRDGSSVGTATTNGSGNWTFDYTNATLSEGLYVFTSTATDAAGNISAISTDFEVEIDITAPNAPSTPDLLASSDSGVSDTDNITNDDTPSFDGTAEAGSRVEIFAGATSLGTTMTNGSGNWNFTVAGANALSDGTYSITARATDVAGNISSASSALSITIDNDAPNAPSTPDLLASSDSGVSDSDNITNDDTPSFDGTAEAGSRVEIFAGATSLGTTMTNGSGNWNFTVAGANSLSDGTYNITARATDVAGNTSSASSALSITIDTDAPNAPSAPDLLASSDSGVSDSDNITNDNTPSFEGTAEAGSTVRLFAGSSSLGTTTADASGDWSFTVAAANALSDGTYNITARATDVAGNTSSASTALSITIDTNAPNAPSLTGITTDTGVSSSDQITQDQTLEFFGSAEAASSVQLSIDGNTVSTPVIAASNGSWTVDYTGTILAEGSYSITARATDVAGNTSITSSTMTVVIDLTTPTIVAVSSNSSNGTYNEGDTLDIRVVFSEIVHVTGSPTLTLETGANDAITTYKQGDGMQVLVFEYIVGSQHTSSDLEYISTSALALNGGSIRDKSGINANLTLPTINGGQSLSDNKALVINAAPTVTALSAQSTCQPDSSAAQSFTIADIDGSFANMSITTSSSNTTLLPNSNIDVLGVNGSRRIQTKPAYGQSGTAVVTVMVSDSRGGMQARSFTLTVDPKPMASFVVGDTCQAYTSVFNNTSGIASGSIVSYAWTFGDGNNSTATNPSNLYAQAGSYNVRLIATSNNGCIDTATATHVVYPKPVASYSTSVACEDKAVQFYDNSSVQTGSITNYNWSFGDAGTSNQVNPSNIYTNTGTYTSRLIVTTDNNCQDTLIRQVEVNPNPEADFATSNVCLYDSMLFTNQSSITVGNLTYNWSFGDSTFSQQENPAKLYTQNGYYSVQLAALSNKGCSDSTSKTVRVYDQPDAAFTAANVCDDEMVRFNNQSRRAVSYSWNFDDGNTSTATNPTHVYASSGIYNVQLVATSSNGCVDTTYNQVSVYSLPSASFTATSECRSDTTVFTNNSTNAVSYTWDYGNGVSSNATQPKYWYGQAGTYSVRLIATSSQGCEDVEIRNVVVHPEPVVQFTAADVCDQTAVSFSNSSFISTGSIASYSWDFGDNNGTSTATTPNYVYANEGQYQVFLTATSNNGCASTSSMIITVHPNPVASWTANNVCDNNEVDFVNGSSINGGTYTSNWDFGDGVGSSNNVSPSYKYGTYGNYTVELTTTSDKGCTDQASALVRVYRNPRASFATTNTCFGDSLMINNTSARGSSYNWNYGDGTSSTLMQNNHYYQNAGVYVIKLIVNSADGCTDSMSRTVEIYRKPIALFTNDSTCHGTAISFESNSFNGNIASHVWLFGDGNMSTLVNPNHQFANAGTYTVSLWVTSDEGCTDTMIRMATVFPNPIPGFSQLNVCANESMDFVNQSTIATGSMTYNWSFGDGSQSTNANPAHLYENDGRYEVVLNAESDKGCMSELSQYVSVYEIPRAQFTVNPNCEGDTTFYQNLSSISNSGMLVQNEWSFGDGNLSTDENAKHLFAAAGSYRTQLVTYSNRGCSDTAMATAVVWAKPIADFVADEVCHLSTTDFVNLSTNAVSYSWYFGDGRGSSILENPQYTYMNPGTYIVTLMANSIRGCGDTLEKEVVVEELPLANFEQENHCLNETFTPNNNSLGSIETYLWYFGDGNTSNDENPVHQYSKEGTYIVSLVVSSAKGCVDSVAREHIVYPMPVMSISEDVTLKRGYSTQLVAGGGSDYFWTPDTWLSDSRIANPIATAIGVVEYTVTITTDMGCASDTTVTVSSDNDYTLEPTNIITPNGNGKNDYWIVDKAQHYTDIEVNVFDRWGRLVYADSAYKNNWDGSVNGNPLPEGTYYYVIKLPTDREPYKGFITIIR